MKPRFPFFALLVVVICFALCWSTKAWYWEIYYPDSPQDSVEEIILSNIPQQVRNLFAGYCWITADEYMHFGPSHRTGAGFTAGTYAGNTEIMPLLELALRLDPHHFDAYGLMSQNLSMYLSRYDDGIRLLQNGIIKNKEYARVHELYGQAAYMYGFADTYQTGKPAHFPRAIRYLDGAIKAYNRRDKGATGFINESPPQFSLETYQSLRSVFFLRLNREDEALAAWKESGLTLVNSPYQVADKLNEIDKRQQAAANATSAAPLAALPPPVTAALPGQAVAPQKEPGTGGQEEHDEHNCTEEGHDHQKPRKEKGLAYTATLTEMFHQMTIWGVLSVVLLLSSRRRF